MAINLIVKHVHLKLQEVSAHALCVSLNPVIKLIMAVTVAWEDRLYVCLCCVCYEQYVSRAT